MSFTKRTKPEFLKTDNEYKECFAMMLLEIDEFFIEKMPGAADNLKMFICNVLEGAYQADRFIYKENEMKLNRLKKNGFVLKDYHNN